MHFHGSGPEGNRKPAEGFFTTLRYVRNDDEKQKQIPRAAALMMTVKGRVIRGERR